MSNSEDNARDDRLSFPGDREMEFNRRIVIEEQRRIRAPPQPQPQPEPEYHIGRYGGQYQIDESGRRRYRFRGRTLPSNST